MDVSTLDGFFVNFIANLRIADGTFHRLDSLVGRYLMEKAIELREV